MAERIEAGEAHEPEIIPEDPTRSLVPIVDEPLEVDVMDNIIAAAKKMEAFDKAYSQIMNIVMKRTFAGDWVSHARGKDAVHLRSASLSGAGCDRVATILGISEKNWKEHPKLMGEDGKSYAFRYEADFTWGGLTRHAYGECSTKNKFFGYEDGKWKELSEVREDHVRKAAQRECQKDGIRRLLGLRKVPIMKLKELGFNIDLVHYVNFKDAKEAVGESGSSPAPTGSSAATAKTESSEAEQVVGTLSDVKFRQWSGKDIMDIVDGEGVSYSWWGKGPASKEATEAVAAKKAGKTVTIRFKTKDGKYRNVESIEVHP